MQLKKTEYKTIEIAEDEDYGMVIGNIVLDKNKMLYAEIVSETICDHEELANVRAFLDKVEEAMETGTVPTILNGGINIETLPDKFRSVVQQRDADITEYIKSICIERIDNVAEKAAINREHAKEMRKKNAIIEELKVNVVRKTALTLGQEIIDDLEAELTEKNRTIHLRDMRIKEQKKTIERLIPDSEVLMKVVEIVREWGRLSAMVCTYDMRHLRDVVKCYLDAPEVPPEHDIVRDQDIAIPGNTSYTVEIDIRCE